MHPELSLGFEFDEEKRKSEKTGVAK